MPLDPDAIDWEPHREQLERFNNLEREVLKRSGHGFSAKQIAKQVGTSQNMVTKAIFTGRTRLGGQYSKAEAGRIVIAWEAAMEAAKKAAEEGVHSLYPQKLYLPQRDDFGPDEPADVQADAQIPHAEPPALEQDALSSFLRRLARRNILMLRTSGRQDNDLKLLLTLAVIAAVAVLALVMAGSAASLLTALNSAYT
ncbi:hypothetical protein K426_24479 [Sphingobium sp. TKS]|nr:hypothetical protein K426_24479 [Sphingobium sp. TKS]PNQ04342.1 hypothetical protein A8G00_01760 [Sphingobium sp. SA916]